MMIHTSSRLKHTLWLGLVLGNAMWAAEMADPAKTETAKPAAQDTKELKEIVVTASRSERAPDTVPAGVNVISAEEISRSHAQNVPELIKGLPGVTVEDVYGNGRRSNIDLRGFGERADANTLVMVDGRRVNPPDMGGIDWTTIPLEQIDRIEVVRGGGSVLYGDRAVGGAVNIITRKGAAKPTLTTDTLVGSYNTFRQGVDFAGGLGGWYYDANSSYFDTKGYRDNGYLRNASAGLSLGYDNDDWWALHMTAGTKKDRYGMPGYVNKYQDRQETNNSRDYAETESNYFLATPSGKFSDTGTLSFGLGWREVTNHSWFYGWSNSIGDSRIQELSVMPKIEETFDIAGIENKVVAGVDWIHSTLNSAWDYGMFGNAFRDAQRDELGVYVNDTLALVPDTLFLDVGARRSHVTYDYEQEPGLVALDRAHNIDAWRAALTWTWQPGGKIFAAVDRSFRTQLLDELAGPWGMSAPLDSYQKSLQYQLGISQEFNRYLALGATGFIIDTDNEIFYNPYATLDPMWGYLGENQTYPQTRRTGIELEAKSKPFDSLTLYANATAMNAELRGGAFDGNRVPDVPRYMANAGLSWSPIEQLTIDTRVRWQNGRLAISDWSNANPSWEGRQFTTIDAKVSYRPWKFLEVYAGVNNLLDREYSGYGVYSATVPGNVGLYPSPERNIYTGFKVTKEF